MRVNFHVPKDDPIKVGERREIPAEDGRVFVVEIEGIDARPFNKAVSSRLLKIRRPGEFHEPEPKPEVSSLPVLWV